MKRSILLAALTVAALVVFAIPAGAHTATISASCTQITVNFTNFTTTTANSATIKLNGGAPITHAWTGASSVKTVAYTGPYPVTVLVEWTVGPGGPASGTFSPTGCTPPTTTPTTTPTTVPPTTVPPTTVTTGPPAIIGGSGGPVAARFTG